MPEQKTPVSGAFWLASLMYFCSGQPMHFCSGVDTSASGWQPSSNRLHLHFLDQAFDVLLPA
jgi:hypothetical protein